MSCLPRFRCHSDRVLLPPRRIAAAACLIAVTACGGGGGSDEPAIIYFGVAAGDLDRDGRADVVLGGAVLNGAPPHPGFVHVSLQRAAEPGQFQRSAALKTAWDPGGIEIADFNGDGIADLAVHKVNLADSTGRIAIFHQSAAADGTFPTADELHLDLVSDMSAVDVNGDGLTDLVTVGPRATVWLNTLGSPGVFTEGQVIDVGASQVRGADLNADGAVDLVLGAGGTGTVRIFLQEAGQFAPAGDFVAGQQLSHIEIADLNDDDRPDLLVAGFPPPGGSALLSVYLQQPGAAGSGVA